SPGASVISTFIAISNEVHAVLPSRDTVTVRFDSFSSVASSAPITPRARSPTSTEGPSSSRESPVSVNRAPATYSASPSRSIPAFDHALIWRSTSFVTSSAGRPALAIDETNTIIHASFIGASYQPSFLTWFTNASIGWMITVSAITVYGSSITLPLCHHH